MKRESRSKCVEFSSGIHSQVVRSKETRVLRRNLRIWFVFLRFKRIRNSLRELYPRRISEFAVFISVTRSFLSLLCFRGSKSCLNDLAVKGNIMTRTQDVNLVRLLSFSLSPHFRNRQLTQNGFCTGFRHL